MKKEIRKIKNFLRTFSRRKARNIKHKKPGLEFNAYQLSNIARLDQKIIVMGK